MEHTAVGALRSLDEIYNELGLALSVLGRHTEAAAAFREAIRERPDAAQPRICLAESLERQHLYSQAIESYLEAIRVAPREAANLLQKVNELLTPANARAVNDSSIADWWASVNEALGAEAAASALVFMARLRFYKDDTDGGLELFEQAIRRQPDNVFALEGIGDSLAKLGRLEEAVAALRQAVTLSDSLRQPDRRTATRFRLARVLMEQNALAESLRVIREGLSIQEPPDARLLILLARNYIELGEPQQALTAVDRAIEGIGGTAEAHSVRAAALLMVGDSQQAIQEADTALKLSASQLLAVRIKAQALIQGTLTAAPSNAELNQGIRLLQVYLREEPLDFERHVLLSDALLRTRRSPEAAIAALHAALRVAPRAQQGGIKLKLASALIDAQKPEEALAVMRELMEKGPELLTPNSYLLIGDAEMQLGREQQAQDAYLRGLRDEPKHLGLLTRVAGLLEIHGNWAEAVSVRHRIVELLPESAEDHLNLARAHHRDGNLNEAEAVAKEAISLAYDYGTKASAYEFLSDLLVELDEDTDVVAEALYEAGRNQHWGNRFAEAAALLERANTLNADHVETYWYWADALLYCGYDETNQTDERSRFSKRAVEVWRKGASHRLPTTEYSWAYTSRALMSDQLVNLVENGKDSADHWWRSVVCLHRAIQLDEGEPYRWTYLSRFLRFLDLDFAALFAIETAYKAAPSNETARSERIAILANLGDFAQARELIESSVQEADWWVLSTSGYVALYQHDYNRAVKDFSSSLDRREDMWARLMRGYSLLMAGKPELARLDFEWIRRNQPDQTYGTSEQRKSYGAAAIYHLALLTGPLSLLDEAIAMLEDLSRTKPDDYADDLGVMYLTRGTDGDVERGTALVEEATRNSRSIRSVRFTLEYGLAFAERWFQAAQRTDKQIDAVARLKEKCRERIAELEPIQPRSKSELLECAKQDITLARDKAGSSDGRDCSAFGTGAQLARIALEQERWREAAGLYLQLWRREAVFGEPELAFPEASIALEKISRALHTDGDQALAAGRYEDARSIFTEALDCVEESEQSTPEALQELRTKVAFAELMAGNTQEAISGFSRVIQGHPASNWASPGETLARVCRGLIADPAAHWKVADAWASLQEALPANHYMRRELATAHKQLAQYFDERYRLTGPVVAPMPKRLTLELSPSLAGAVSPGSSLVTRIAGLRRALEDETGVPLPIPGVSAAADCLSSSGYSILIDGTRVRAGVLPEAPSADSMAQLASELERSLRQNLAAFVSADDVAALWQRWINSNENSALLFDYESGHDKAFFHLRQVLQALVREHVPIRAWQRVLQALIELKDLRGDLEASVAAVRKKLAPLEAEGSTRIQTPPELEDAISRHIEKRHGGRVLVIDPAELARLHGQIASLVGSAGQGAILVTRRSDIRPFLQRLVGMGFSDIRVLASSELRITGTTVKEIRNRADLGSDTSHYA
ncbi:MAG: tetratricopeptide repeat protein [Bryobacteraceae bacterium]